MPVCVLPPQKCWVVVELWNWKWRILLQASGFSSQFGRILGQVLAPAASAAVLVATAASAAVPVAAVLVTAATSAAVLVTAAASAAVLVTATA